jgi:membrane protein DedA with SNARE-associated domain
MTHHFDTALNILIIVVKEHRYLGYAFLFFGMIVEGEVFLMIAGILANLNAFSLEEVFAVSFAGVLVNDVFWYHIGVYLKNNHGHRSLLQRAEKKVKKLLPNIESNPAYAIFISKFIAGFNHPTLIILGFLKTNFKYFMKLQVLASLVWTLIFISLGFAFGHTAISVSRRIHVFIIAAVVLIAAVMLLERGIRYVVNKNGSGLK